MRVGSSDGSEELQGKERWKPPEAGRGKEWLLPRALKSSTASLTLLDVDPGFTYHPTMSKRKNPSRLLFHHLRPKPLSSLFLLSTSRFGYF